MIDVKELWYRVEEWDEFTATEVRGLLDERAKLLEVLKWLRGNIYENMEGTLVVRELAIVPLWKAVDDCADIEVS